MCVYNACINIVLKAVMSTYANNWLLRYSLLKRIYLLPCISFSNGLVIDHMIRLPCYIEDSRHAVQEYGLTHVVLDDDTT